MTERNHRRSATSSHQHTAMPFPARTPATDTLMVIASLFALFIAAPVGIIWALNTLFNLTIPLTLQTWMAVLILVTTLRVLRGERD